jgi:hypothetical protein
MPFRRYEYTTAQEAEILGIAVNHIYIEGGVGRSFLPLEILRDGLLSPAFLDGNGLLRRVEHTDDTERIHPTVLRADGSQLYLAFEHVGKCKNAYWSFQRKRRYLMSIVPFDIRRSVLSDPVAERNVMVSRLINGQLAPACGYYDLRLVDDAMKDMGIVPSPKMSAGNRVLLACLLEKYDLTANLKPSQLEGSL